MPCVRDVDGEGDGGGGRGGAVGNRGTCGASEVRVGLASGEVDDRAERDTVGTDRDLICGVEKGGQALSDHQAGNVCITFPSECLCA